MSEFDTLSAALKCLSDRHCEALKALTAAQSQEEDARRNRLMAQQTEADYRTAIAALNELRPENARIQVCGPEEIPY